ncbi:MAG TPA: hypothetical protein VMP86_06630 [Candidatus Binatia bacterium]|nr:hypothetical protein [Candidatus Binatia bacterium]
MTRRGARATILALLLASCGGPSSPSPSPAETVEVAVPEPGRPFDGAGILAAMRDSRRPGGVAEPLQTAEIAGAVADAIWTVDGEPWTTIAAGGSCGPDECTLEVGGSRAGAAGEDAWTFHVVPAAGEVTVLSAQLGSVPDELVANADRLARGADADGLLDGLILAGHSWQPPPDVALIILAYRAGDEEGSCRRDVSVDVRDGEVAIGEGVDC